MTKRKDEALNREEPVFWHKKKARKMLFPSKTKTTNKKKVKWNVDERLSKIGGKFVRFQAAVTAGMEAIH